jgi:diguanylate cyclase (GGDEF)-like protein
MVVIMEDSEGKCDGNILVVDDNPVITKMLEEVLGRVGYAVTAAAGGAEALQCLHRGVTDLVLLDVDMPEESGLSVCRRIKANAATRDIPVIFVTSRADRGDIVAGFEAGGQDYIAKPFTRAELLARVRTHLTLRRAQENLREAMVRYRQLSIVDDLTGFYNTRHLYQSLQEQLESHPETALTVVFIDIDNFKKVVDGYGHLHGSSTIAELAEVVMALLPPGSYGVSYGGDEFVLVLVGLDRAAGPILAEKIRAAVAANRFLSYCDLNIHVTISSGTATYPDDALTLAELLACADHALFQAKRSGRNMVVPFAEITVATARQAL